MARHFQVLIVPKARPNGGLPRVKSMKRPRSGTAKAKSFHHARTSSRMVWTRGWACAESRAMRASTHSRPRRCSRCSRAAAARGSVLSRTSSKRGRVLSCRHTRGPREPRSVLRACLSPVRSGTCPKVFRYPSFETLEALFVPSIPSAHLPPQITVCRP
jgi:hypothetical protein